VAAQSSHVDVMLKVLLESRVENAGDLWMGTLHIVRQVEEYEYNMCRALAEKLFSVKFDGYRSQFKHIPFDEVTRIHSGVTRSSCRSCCVVGLQYAAISICAAPATAGASPSSNVQSQSQPTMNVRSSAINTRKATALSRLLIAKAGL
jgi:hypothetical protein